MGSLHLGENTWTRIHETSLQNAFTLAGLQAPATQVSNCDDDETIDTAMANSRQQLPKRSFVNMDLSQYPRQPNASSQPNKQVANTVPNVDIYQGQVGLQDFV